MLWLDTIYVTKSGQKIIMFTAYALICPNCSLLETGIGNWTREDFIKRFKAYDLSTYVPPSMNKGDLMTIMPWTMYAGMDSSDLSSVYQALQALKPTNNKVVRWMPYK